MARRSSARFVTIRTEGGLLPSELLQRLVDRDADLGGLTEASYHLLEGIRLHEAVTESWTRLGRVWVAFQQSIARLAETDPITGVTRDRWLLPLFHELGYGRLVGARPLELDGKSYPISHAWQTLPIHLVGWNVDLDRRSAGVPGAAKVSPHGLVQELVNRSKTFTWGVVSNGRRLRLLRDNVSLTRQAYVEFDLEAMFRGEVYSDFVVLWLLLHQSRVEGERPGDWWIERWTQEAHRQGARLLDRLRDGVQRAIEILGQGFLTHPRNGTLHVALQTGDLHRMEYYRQLLRLVYRLLFLFVAEDRGLLLDPAADKTAVERYVLYYSTGRLRDLAGRLRGTAHSDLWQALSLVMEKLGDDRGCSDIGLPALNGGLWNLATTKDLNKLQLSNQSLLSAVRALAWTETDRLRRPVDYRNLGPEELGSVYESLLELHPEMNGIAGSFTLAAAQGHERKTTGSYYTPPSLVRAVLDSALDPVLDGVARTRDPEAAILALNVCDPACGSGHFLIAAAHRIARRLATVRTGEDEPSPEALHRSLRDVIGRCIYGVDVNEMAVELCKVGLWMEALEPGKPLSFLDHHIRAGNSLLGATPELIAAGLPDEAFAPMEPDDRRACAALKKRNGGERSGAGPLFEKQDAESQTRLQRAAAALEDLPDDRAADIRAKELAFRRHEEDYRQRQRLADAWCAAFVIKKYFRVPGREASASGITQAHLNDLVGGQMLPPELAAEVDRLSAEYHFFHWHLAFPEVFRAPKNGQKPENTPSWSGGFDVVLGNPPWVRQEALRKVKNLLSVFKSFKSTADLSVFFLDLASLIVRVGGRVGLLTPNKWFVSDYGRNLRTLLRQRVRFHLVIDFGHSKTLFSDADTFPAAVVVEPVDVPTDDSESLQFLSASDAERKQQSLVSLLADHSIAVEHRQLTQERYQFADNAVTKLIARLVESGIPLEEYVGKPLFRGILTGFNEAFVIDKAQRERLISEDSRSSELIRPWLSGREVARWLPRWQGEYVIFTRHGTDIDQYPAIKAHLLRWKARLTPRGFSREGQEAGAGRKPGTYKWYEIQDNVAFYKLLELPKIVFREIAYHSQFAVDYAGTYCNKTVHMIPIDDFYVLAILNSRVGWWLMNHTLPHMKDGALLLQGSLIGRFPVPDAVQSLKTDIATRARALREAIDLESHTRLLDREVELNTLVMAAFGLDEGDRKTMNIAQVSRDPIQVLSETARVDLYGLSE
jgi:hypothetical protein